MGTPVIVDNRPGAGGTIGAAFAANSAPDGYTLLILNLVPHTSSKGLYKNLPFDPVQDFSALGLVGDTPYIVAVNPSRSEERRVGKECVSTCRSRWSPYY